MFRIESYITPIILNYVAKYVKNIRPQDAQFSLWEGDVIFQNLDLRLDVLEEELNLPFEFLSGHIHELSIHVPWTKITSEPIRITINTIEFVLKLKDERAEGTSSSASASPQRGSTGGSGGGELVKHRGKRTSKQEAAEQQQQPQQPTPGSGLVNKIINNISVQCHNIILKYVEEDIVVSMNVQLLSFDSADEQWQPAMVDIHPVKVLLRKRVQISDLTICLDKRNSAGQIEVCQEPILYRCTLECRILRKYNVNTVATTSTTRIGVLTKCLDMNISSLQFPMVMRLIKLIYSLKTGQIKTFTAVGDNFDDEPDEQESDAQTQGSYLAWAWNLLPSFNFELPAEEEQAIAEQPGHTRDIGIYVEQLNFTLKNSEFINDMAMGGVRRIRYTPIMRISLGGLYFETMSAEERNWSSMKAGLSSICVEPLGTYRSDESTNQPSALIESASFKNPHSYIDKSLFDEQWRLGDSGWGATNYEDYSTCVTDEYLLFRSPILAFDTVEYKSSSAEDTKAAANGAASSAVGGSNFDPLAAAADGVQVHYRLLSAGVTFRFNQTLLQVKHVISDFVDSYDYPAYYAERLDAAGGSNPAAPTKLPPPLMEDYDALMAHVQLRTYKIDIKRFAIEFYAKVDAPLIPTPAQKTQSATQPTRRQSGSPPASLPHFLLHLEHGECTLSTPLHQDKLVHTTCQLPDKPQQLLDACYDNYHLNLKELSLALVNKSLKRNTKLLHIPAMQVSYGSLLQPQHWTKDDADEYAVPERKLDLYCDLLNVVFSKRECVTSVRLLQSVCSYSSASSLWKMARQEARPIAAEDHIRLQNRCSKVRVQMRGYRSCSIWNGSLRGMLLEIVQQRHFESNPKIVFNTSSKLHANHHKWLEFQAQVPTRHWLLDEADAGVDDQQSEKFALALWVEYYRISVDSSLLEFLRHQEHPDSSLERDSTTIATELPAQSQTTVPVQPPLPSGGAALSHTLQRRNTSRTALVTRRVSQPEETVHFSSERDDKMDVETTVSASGPTKATTANNKDNNTESKIMWLKFIKSIIVHVEIVHGKMDIADHIIRNIQGQITSTAYTQIHMPKLVLKSTYADHIVRSNLRRKISIARTSIRDKEKDKETTFNWTIVLNDFAVQNRSISSAPENILDAVQTTVTIAMMHKTEKEPDGRKTVSPKGRLGSISSKIQSPEQQQQQQKQQRPSVPTFTAESIAGSNSPEGRSEASFEMDDSPYVQLETPVAATAATTEGGGGGSGSGQEIKKAEKEKNGNRKTPKLKDIYTLNVHVDTTPIHLYISTEQAKTLQQNVGILLNVLQSIHTTSKYQLPEKNNTKEEIRIVTAAEENASIKEFMDLDSSSETSNKSDDKSISLFSATVFGQWTIARFIIELQSSEDQIHHSKIMLELEDLLATMDKRDDFTKYTSKVGQFNVNFFEPDARGEWKAHEYLRIKMLGEATNMPILNVIVTRVGVRNFYKRIGARRKGQIDPGHSISEVLITLQAIEMIVNLDKIREFIVPLCMLFESVSREDEFARCKKPVVKSRPLTTTDLPMVHLDSKGFTLYVPLQTGKECCSVVIWRIESIKISPNLQNPLQRSPIRTDVFGKAAQMGILNTPGSMVEDRQYELTLRNISTASGNWHEILTHMREESNNFQSKNPAFEWNNQNRKPALQLTEIFSAFNFVAIYAPHIVYNNVLICGQAIEFNCVSDFLATITTYQLNLFSCLILRLQNISCLIHSACRERKPRPRVPHTLAKSVSDTAIHSKYVASKIDVRLRTLNMSTHNNSSNFIMLPETWSRHKIGGVPTFPSIHEDTSDREQWRPLLKNPSDSGFQSCQSRSQICAASSSRDRFASLSTLSSCSAVLDRVDLAHTPTSSHPERHLSHTLSLVAGTFLVRIFDNRHSSKRISIDLNTSMPLISLTISQPSFMITQNIFDAVTHVSLFNLSISVATNSHTQQSQSPGNSINLFSEVVFSTRPGEATATGIPPPLFSLKSHRSKQQFVELDVELARPINITLNESHTMHLCTNLLLVYASLLDNPCFEVRPKTAVQRGSKIKLMRQRFFDADHLHFKCDRIMVKFLNPEKNFNCKLVSNEIKCNVKFLTRPEKAIFRAHVGAIYMQTDQKIFVHPISLRISADFISEPWHCLPLVVASIKFNVIHADVGIYTLRQLRSAAYGFERLSTFAYSEWRRFLRGHLYETLSSISFRQNLVALQCPSQSNLNKHKQTCGKCKTQREEFYQDDLRAGAFQFVEMASDDILPMPYQIQIIKKNYGIICWRYPQPRKMCKIHIFPVPMAVPNPIHIKCRMEYFSEVHEGFQHYCDFWLSETVSKHIELPNREICANIWRVVIMQSLVSVNGEYFDNSEEDDELQSISSIKIEQVLNAAERSDTDFILHPKVLVGCMRIDTSFQSACVPKVQLLVSGSLLHIKLCNQPDENVELPALLKKFRLAQTSLISQVFMMAMMEKMSFHAAFYDAQDYSVDSNLTCRVKVMDYGFLNMMNLLEPSTLQSHVRVNRPKRSLVVNIMFDKLRLNVGPSIIHSLLSSKAHWQELLDENNLRKRHALIPKCLVVNRMSSDVSFGQTGTTERIQLHPRECHLYSFRSDYHSQELTFFVGDLESQITETSQSVPIPFKFEGDTKIVTIRIGNKCLIIKSRKLSSTQIFVLIKGQVELISMVPHDFRLELRRELKQSNEKQHISEYNVDQKGRGSFYCHVLQSTNIFMRLKFANNKGKARTGDIPLRTNKNLPWLVKVPTANNEFISFWVRVLRENIPEVSSDKFQPQKIMITIWPIFEIYSMLNCPITAVESTTNQILEMSAEGGRSVLDVPATHLTEHKVAFQYNFPIGPLTKSDYTLTLKTLDWNKFFWYDEERWKTENAIDKLSKADFPKYPVTDEEERRVRRISHVAEMAHIQYKCMPTREFSCTLGLEVSAWGIFINTTGIEVSIRDCDTQQRLCIVSNCLEMMFHIRTAYTLEIPNGSSWIASLPIYFDETAAATSSRGSGRYYVLTAGGVGIDIVILRSDEILKFVLELTVENERRVFRLRSKFVIANFSKKNLCALPFAMDHKENGTMKDVQSLNANVRKRDLITVNSMDNCIGISLDSFYDLNARKAQRSNDTAFVYFVSIKICEDSDVSIPIPLSMPFTRRCFSIQYGALSLPFVVALIEKGGVYYLNIFDDNSPAILVSNQTDVRFIIAQTSASEHSIVSNTTPEYDGRHFVWYQILPAYSNCYYTPPEMYANFPDVESTMCNLTLALANDKNPTKKTIKWSKPIRTDKTWEKFLHIPHHGDVKVIICDKHRVIRVSIYYIAQQSEFSVKDIRSRLLTPPESRTTVISKASQAESDYLDQSIVTLSKVPTLEDIKALQMATSKCTHFSNHCDSKLQVKARVFVKEIVLSLHTDSHERDYMKCETFGMYIDDFVLAYDDDDDGRRQLNVLLGNLQIDNQLYASGKYDFPVVLCAQQLYKRTTTVPRIHYLDRCYQELRAQTPMALLTFNFYEDELKLSSIVCSLSPVRAYIEDAYLNDLLDALLECEPSNCVYRPKREKFRILLAEGEILLPHEVAAQAICIAEPLQLRSFRIEPLSVLLSVHTSVRLYIALDHSPLSFSAYERRHVLTVPLRFGQSLGMHYLSGAIFGAGWVVGSLEILGSPSGLARSFTTGLRDFVSMPVQGLFRGPWGFVVGITQGSASLLRNVTTGTVNSVTKLASSVARNLDRLSLDQEHIDRTDALRRTRPQGFTEGFSQGITGLGISILGAVGGIAHHTLEARSPVQVVTGMGKGLVGALTKPLSGAAELVALAGQGMLHTVGFNAMPQQRAPTVCHNAANNPSAYRIWKLLPGVLATDQVLFYHEITLLVQNQLCKGYAFLTSAVFAITLAQWDKLAFVIPVDKVQLKRDSVDRTLMYVHILKEEVEDIEEDLSYTNQRIMKFLRSSVSVVHMTTDSLNDLLQTPSQFDHGRKSQDWAFYIMEHLGDHLMQYITLINTKRYKD